MSATEGLADQMAEQVAQHPRVPAFIKWLGAAIVAVVALSTGALINLAQERCEDRADNRSDARALWLYLIEQNDPDRAKESTQRFVAFMNERLPELDCDWRGAVVPAAS